MVISSAITIACGARTGLDSEPAATELGGRDASASSGAGTEITDAGVAIDDAEQSAREGSTPCSSYKVLETCIGNGCSACIAGPGEPSQGFLCYSGDQGCGTGPNGEPILL